MKNPEELSVTHALKRYATSRCLRTACGSGSRRPGGRYCCWPSRSGGYRATDRSDDEHIHTDATDNIVVDSIVDLGIVVDLDTILIALGIVVDSIVDRAVDERRSDSDDDNARSDSRADRRDYGDGVVSVVQSGD